MTIFISIPWFSPAYKAGGPIQSIVNLVNEYKENIHYFVFCGDTDLNEEPLTNVEKDQWSHYNEWTKVWYAAKDRSNTLLEEAKKIKPGIVFIIGIYSWHFNLVPILFLKNQQKIVSVRGMLHPGALSQKKIKKKLFMGALKLSGMANKIVFHATDEIEKKYIQDTFGNPRIYVASNFPRKFLWDKPLYKEAGTLRLISIALISPMKNHLLVLESLQQCKGRVVYTICGSVKDSQYWENCNTLINQLPGNIEVNYFDNIEPGQVETMLKENHVFILPSKSENFAHAIFEALSAGKPVITSKFTPWQGLRDKGAGKNVDLDVSAISDAIDFFVGMDYEEYSRWSQHSKEYSEAALDFDKIREQYRVMFDISG
ncbi:MAG TPA: glycosyltransferase [Ferruginibacter sp.]|nr:glycosyltransferase [Ferruginibacter sp.]